MRISVSASMCSMLLALCGAASAQEAITLKQAFETAWTRQPEARGSELRRAAAVAKRDAAGNWLVAPPNLDMSTKTDRVNRNDGSREYEVGVGLPLWLPGERGSAQALADAEADALISRLQASQLRLAAILRESWWAAVQAQVDVDVAQARLRLAEQLGRDVTRRVKAGDLSKADQHQADGAVAGAQAALAESVSAQAGAAQRLRSLLGVAVRGPVISTPESVPPVAVDESQHPALREIADRAEAARKAKGLAATQTRANPQLLLATTRERDAFTSPYAQTVTVGVRIPFGADSRQRARMAVAEAEAVEAETQLEFDREQILAGIDAARARVDASQALLRAAERRAQLASETRGFFDKSFRLGESDLPTRLRIELEAYEAERQLARSRVSVAYAISQLRQALGLLPE